jgi:hypothetical protein
MGYRRRIKRRFTRAVGEKYRKARSKENRINVDKENDKIFRKTT